MAEEEERGESEEREEREGGEGGDEGERDNRGRQWKGTAVERLSCRVSESSSAAQQNCPSFLLMAYTSSGGRRGQEGPISDPSSRDRPTSTPLRYSVTVGPKEQGVHSSLRGRTRATVLDEQHPLA